MERGHTTIRILIFGAAAAICGCLGPPEAVPELNMPIGDAPPPGFEESVAARIEESLPRVSYSPGSPDYLGPLVSNSRSAEGGMDRELIEGWIRQLESLNGDRPVVCQSTPRSVFGECSFPTSERAIEQAPATSSHSSR